MDENRLMMKGRLEELRRDQKKWRHKAKMLLRDMARTLNPALRDVEDMEVADAAMIMDELVMAQAELLGLRTRIRELEEALYG